MAAAQKKSAMQAKERAPGEGAEMGVGVFACKATMAERTYNKGNSSKLKLKVCRRQPAVTVLSIL